MKLWPHSLDKELKQLNVQDTLELDKSRSGRGQSHTKTEKVKLIFTSLHFNVNQATNIFQKKSQTDAKTNYTEY